MLKIVNIGDKFKNNKGYEYEVVQILDKGKYEIKFVNSGFTTISSKKEVLNGSIKDWEAPSVCGVGIVGKKIKHPQKHYLYDRWRDMLRRCYDTNTNNYKDYGGSGVTVDKRWHYFVNYIADIELKENSDKLKIKNSGWEVDKDINGNDTKIYSNETTTIVTVSENVKERNDRDGNPAMYSRLKVMRFSTNGDYINTFESISEAVQFFNKDTGHSSIIDCCKGKSKTAFGYAWMYERDFVGFEAAKIKILQRINYIPPKKLKTILLLDENNTILKEFEGLRAVAKYLNVQISSISNSIYRKHKCKGYFLKFKEVE